MFHHVSSTSTSSTSSTSASSASGSASASSSSSSSSSSPSWCYLLHLTRMPPQHHPTPHYPLRILRARRTGLPLKLTEATFQGGHRLVLRGQQGHHLLHLLLPELLSFQLLAPGDAKNAVLQKHGWTQGLQYMWKDMRKYEGLWNIHIRYKSMITHHLVLKSSSEICTCSSAQVKV